MEQKKEMDENIQSDNPGGKPGFQQSKLKRGMDIFGCLFAINICFVISCIPIITIGAAMTALYAMMFRIQRHDDDTVVREYFQEFKANFKKSTIVWLIVLLIGVVLWGQYAYILNFEGGLVNFYDFLMVIELIALCLVLPFLFPLLAYYDNSIANTFKNSFLLAISNFGSWIKMFIAWFATIAFSFGYEAIILNTWYLWFLIMFGLLAYGTSLTARKVFDKVATVQEEKKVEAEAHAAEAEEQEDKNASKSGGLFRTKKDEQPKRSIKERLAVMDEVNGVKTKEE